MSMVKISVFFRFSIGFIWDSFLWFSFIITVRWSGLVWHNLSNPHHHISVQLLKSSSNWTKLYMMGPQLFLGLYQIILAVFRCSQLFSDVPCCFPMFSDVFSWAATCMHNHPLCGHFSQDNVRCFRMFQRCFQMFQRCFQMFSAVFRCSQLFSNVLSSLSPSGNLGIGLVWDNL